MGETFAGYSNTPHLVAEAMREGMTLSDKAAQVLAVSAQWVAISTAIEDRRLAAKAAVSIAGTISEAKSAAAIDWSDIEALA